MDERLLRVLARSRSLGFLGPGPVEDHLSHAEGFVTGLAEGTERLLDLGSGGGVPGLVLAEGCPSMRLVLLDSNRRRCTFLREAVGQLGMDGQVEVLECRAEAAGRLPEYRSTFDAVVSRGFGPPAVTAECAAPFLAVGGRLVVSEPPEGPERWPAPGLARLGMEVGPRYRGHRTYQVLLQVSPCPTEFARRPGVPLKRPVF